jgi:hypothetical protein
MALAHHQGHPPQDDTSHGHEAEVFLQDTGPVRRGRWCLMTRKAGLRKAIRNAGYGGTAPYKVYDALLSQCYGNDTTVQVTWDTLQEKLGGMPWWTFKDARDHLGREGWLTWHRGTGWGRPNIYELHHGQACLCRPGRGNPMTAAERKFRSRFWAEAARLVTLSLERDAALAQDKDEADVTLSLDKDVTLTNDKDEPNVTTDERDIPQVDAAFVPCINVSPQETPVTTTGGSVKDAPSKPSALLDASFSPAGDEPSPVGERQQPSSLALGELSGGISHTGSLRSPVYENDLANPVWAVIAATTTGPCARCCQLCERYGDGGKPLCDNCTIGL